VYDIEHGLAISFIKDYMDVNGDSYITGVSLQDIETYRGIKVGDSREKLFELYGRPTTIQKYHPNTYYVEIIYSMDDLNISFTLDETASSINYIFIDYNSKKSSQDLIGEGLSKLYDDNGGYKFDTKNLEQDCNIPLNCPKLHYTYTDVSFLGRCINSKIESCATKPFYYKINGHFEVKKSNINGTFVYNSKNLLSILFEGLLSGEDDDTKDNYILYGANIDMTTGEVILASDLFDESFKEKINENIFTNIDTGEPAPKELYDTFRDSFYDCEYSFYFDKDKFVIILPVNGRYLLGADYKDLVDCMKLDNPIWDEFLNKKQFE